MHYQVSPHEEAKIVSCMKGTIYDIVFDLQNDSNMYGQWVDVELANKIIRCSLSQKDVPMGSRHSKMMQWYIIR